MGALQYMISARSHRRYGNHCTTILSDTPEALVICMQGYNKRGRKDKTIPKCERCLKSHYAQERVKNGKV